MVNRRFSCNRSYGLKLKAALLRYVFYFSFAFSFENACYLVIQYVMGFVFIFENENVFNPFSALYF